MRDWPGTRSSQTGDAFEQGSMGADEHLVEAPEVSLRIPGGDCQERPREQCFWCPVEEGYRNRFAILVQVVGERSRATLE